MRDKFLAHKEISDPAQVEALFSKTSVDELRRLVTSLQSLHESLWQLFYNGRKPVLRPMRHSIKRMRDLPTPKGGTDSVQEQEAEQFLLTAARVDLNSPTSR
jgi:HEPN superfamily AbiU2-like protein